MKNYRNYFFILVFITIPFCLRSQNDLSLIDNSQVPNNIKWRKIDGVHCKIIFPESIENEAVRVANTIDYLYPFEAKTSSPPSRINIILNTQLTLTNGYTTLVPRKIMFFSTPPQNSFAGAINWYNLLSVHEFRHVTQYSLCDHGFTKVAHILFGNVAQAALTELTIPLWYFEGDAVSTETALTNSGRGRLPQFSVEYRSLLLSGIRYKYNKLYYGSYKDWTLADMPYSFGYQFVCFLRRHYGWNKMNRVLLNASRKSFFFPYSFELTMKKYTGKTLRQNYNLMMNELDSAWSSQADSAFITQNKPVTVPVQNNWTYNIYPKYPDKDHIIVFRYGQEDMYEFVKISLVEKNEEVIYQSGYINDDSPFSLSGNKMVWAETHPDIRWGNRSYSDIMMCDLTSGSVKQVTFHSKYYSPAISPDMKYISTVEFNESDQCSILILDAGNGNILKRIKSPDNAMVLLPSWANDGKTLAFVSNDKLKGSAICQLDIEKEHIEFISEYSFENKLFPVIAGDFIYYDSPYSGIDNIYAVNVHSKKIFRVISAKYGAYYPSISPGNDKIIFSSVSSLGYEVDESDLNPGNFVPLEKIKINKDLFFAPLVEQEQGGDVLKNIPDNKYDSKKYNSIIRWPNFYSWSLLPGTNTGKSDISLSLKSENLLGSSAVTITRSYNLNEETNFTSLGLTYAVFYPIINIGGTTGSRSSTFDTSIIRSGRYVDTTMNYSWNEQSVYAGISLPFDFSAGKYQTTLIAGVSTSCTKIDHLTRSSEYAENDGVMVPMNYEVNFSRTTAWMRDFYPEWGQVLQIKYSNTPFKSDYHGELFSFIGDFYFPGIIKHNSLNFNLGYEVQDPVNYRFESLFLFPRGYNFIFEKKLFKAGVNYAFPLLYPDIGIRSTLYCKRIIYNLFYDYGIGINNQTDYFRSAGVEMNFETYFFKIPAPVFLGVRYSYLFDKNENTSVTRPVEFFVSFGL